MTALDIVNDYFDMALGATKNRNQIVFFEWAKSQSKETVISSVREIWSENAILELIEEYKFRPKECFRTAAIFALDNENVTYVEGYSVWNGLQFPHAINKIILADGSVKYFDFQAEVVNKNSFEELKFVALKEFTLQELEEEIYLPQRRYSERVSNWYYEIYLKQVATASNLD